VLQITSAQQYAPIQFILLHLKLNRTGGSTHWRRKYKTRSIRSTKSARLTIRPQQAIRSNTERISTTMFIRRRILRVLPFVTRRQPHTDSIPGCFIRPKRTSTLGNLNEAAMSTRLHTARQVNAAHWCAATLTNLLHKLTK